MTEISTKHYTIAVMTGSIQSDYSEELMRGIYACAQENNASVMLLMGPQIPTGCSDIVASSTTGNYRHQFETIYQYIHYMKPDAAIVTYGSVLSSRSAESKRKILRKIINIPCVVVEDKSYGEKFPYLIADNYSGMKACICHLIEEHGYKKITFLSGPKGNYDAEERLRAYTDTMAEYNLEVTNTMVAYGDYTDHVDEQICYLLDNNPEVEAIVCADDVMAKACYRVCAMRNLIVGKDVAITGFDDTSSAPTLNPPLTSVSQNNFQIGYRAMKNAIAMCKGKEVISEDMPTILRKRCSCGCSPMRILNARYIPQDEISDFIDAAVVEMANYLFSSVAYTKERMELSETLSEYCFYVYKAIFAGGMEEFSMETLMDILRKMASDSHVPNELLLKHLEQLLQILLANAPDGESQKLIASIISFTQQFVHSYNIELLEKQIFQSNRKSWFVPMFTRDLASESYIRNPQEIFYRIMEEMKKMAVRSAYFFLFDEPVLYQSGGMLDFPKEMNLVACYNADNMKFFHQEEQPKFTNENGFLSYISKIEQGCFTSVLLFSENKQYGLLVCDVDYEDIAFLQICSVQIGTLLHFIELNQLEQQAQNKLQNSLRVIKEQNRILSFLSEFDELTKLLNRRGFIERALALYERSEGDKAYLIFGDLDHLKEINDVYGHAEGDFAIREIAARFQTILPANAVIGRIGGDEFVSFLITEEKDFKERIIREFDEESKEFNQSCDKPYYVETSIGVYEFICNPQEDFGEMLKKSDQLLYQAKAARRKSVKKP